MTPTPKSKEKPTKTKALTLIPQKEISPVVQNAQFLVVNNPKDMELATSSLSSLNTYLKRVIAYKESKTAPLNATLKIIRAETKPLEEALSAAIVTIRQKMSVYQTEQKRISDAEAAKIAARVGTGKGHFTAETATKKIDEIDAPATAVTTDAGTVRFRTDRKLKITDPDKVLAWMFNHQPTYLSYPESTVLILLKEGVQIDGAEIEEIQVPLNNIR